MTDLPETMLSPWANDQAPALSIEVCGRLRDHFLELLAIVERALGVDLREAARTLRTLDVSRPVAPRFHALYWSLRRGIEGSALDTVVDTVRALLNTPCGGLSEEGLRVESVLSEAWERPIIAEYRTARFTDQPAAEGASGGVVIRPLLEESLAAETRAVRRAIEVIARVEPALSREIRHYLRRIKLFSGSISPGGSTIAAQGVIFMMPAHGRSSDPVVYYVDWLVHECAHMHLGSLMMIDPILAEEGQAQASPLRPDRRPMPALIHAVFVLSRLVRVFRRLDDGAAVELGLAPAEVDRRLRQHERHLYEGAETVRKAAVFTAAGERIFAPILELARECEPGGRAERKRAET